MTVHVDSEEMYHEHILNLCKESSVNVTGIVPQVGSLIRNMTLLSSEPKFSAPKAFERDLMAT
jgi:hypothetical protein